MTEEKELCARCFREDYLEEYDGEFICRNCIKDIEGI